MDHHESSRRSPSKISFAFTDEWRRWIAENLILNVEPAALFRILVDAGYSQQVADIQTKAALRDPYFAGANGLKNRSLKRDWIIDI